MWVWLFETAFPKCIWNGPFCCIPYIACRHCAIWYTEMPLLSHRLSGCRTARCSRSRLWDICSGCGLSSRTLGTSQCFLPRNRMPCDRPCYTWSRAFHCIRMSREYLYRRGCSLNGCVRWGIREPCAQTLCNFCTWLSGCSQWSIEPLSFLT